MRRRGFIGLVGGAAVWPLAAEIVRAAEPNKVYRVAAVSPVSASDMSENGTVSTWKALFLELRRLGYVEGKNLVVLRFSSEGDTSRLDAIVRDAVSAEPDVIFVSGSRLALRLKAATNVIPVVGNMAEPIEFGIVSSLARPGGNITGVTTDAGREIWGKRLAILREVSPTATRIGFLGTDEVWEGPIGIVMRDVATQVSVSLVGSHLLGALEESEYRRVFDTFKQENAQGIVVIDQAENLLQRRLVVELAQQYRIPAIYPFREFVDSGGLMAYAVDVSENYRRMAGYADLIFKGAKPGEMPIFQVTKYSTIINLKTTKELGLEIPYSLLASADEVIE
jgi:putative tryptophan/tyrosine transport system substrate-binding protein